MRQMTTLVLAVARPTRARSRVGRRSAYEYRRLASSNTTMARYQSEPKGSMVRMSSWSVRRASLSHDDQLQVAAATTRYDDDSDTGQRRRISKQVGQQKVIDFAFRNRLHLLPAATLIVWAAPPLYGSSPTWRTLPPILLVGFGVYQINRVFDLVEDEINDASAYRHTLRRRASILALATAAMSASVILSVILSNYAATVALVAIVVLGVLYSVPFLRVGGRGRLRLKQILILKNVVPSLVWALTTIVYPALESGEAAPFDMVLAVVALGTAIFTIEVAWDVRDMRGDSVADVRTLANAYGAHRALLVPLVTSLVAAAAIVVIVAFGEVTLLWLMPAAFLVVFSTLAYMWTYALASDRRRSHVLVLINTLSLVPLGLAGYWGYS
jgi:4-hydroxybenzoate polyprenyltransferase